LAFFRFALGSAALGLVLGCQPSEVVDDHEHEDDAWVVTAWGEQYEIFAEADGLVAGVPVKSHTHVTVLSDFSPMREGGVSIVLRDGGPELVFTEEAPIRDGIYSIEIAVGRAGTFDLAYRVESPAGVEEIAGGRIEVAAAGGEPGGLLEEEIMAVGAPISFLKEQQWKTTFATEWVEVSALGETLRVPGRVRPVAGGEVLITAPVDGILTGSRWPHIGLAVDGGERLFRLTPRTGAARSLAELSAEVAAQEAELVAAELRTTRMTELVETGAASQAELERARSASEALSARVTATRQDLTTAQAARSGELSDETALAVRAPFAGRIGEVMLTPGEAVTAGQAVVRLVKSEPVWVELALAADEVQWLPEQPAGLTIDGRSFGADQVRLVSVAPGVNAESGTVLALLEVATSVDELRLGLTTNVEVLRDSEITGVVVPASAVVDDGGVSVVYLQIDGESFARTEVNIVARQGDRVMVEGLALGARLATVGGDAIRRATLVATDAGEGHIH
jgi:RND family efflux transporter MFP subunit